MLLLPFANTRAMQMHLDEISCDAAAKTHGVVLRDRAGAARPLDACGDPNVAKSWPIRPRYTPQAAADGTVGESANSDDPFRG